MAARLPKPGENSWGEILNSFLSVSHTNDGHLQAKTVGTAQLQDGAVSLSKLDTEVRSLLQAPSTTLSKAARHDQAVVAATTTTTTQPVVKTAALTTPGTDLGLITRAYYAPEDFGCARWTDPSINDAAIDAAIKAATANNGVVQFIGKGPYDVSRAIEQDVSKFIVRGNKTVLNVVDEFSGPYFWSVYSSADYPYGYNQGPAISGVSIEGSPLSGSTLSTTGVRIGHTTYINNCLFSIEGMHMKGFATGFKYISNSWRVKLLDCRVTGGVALDVPQGLSNFGENMVVENSIFESYNPTINIGSGEWVFNNCSFNNTLITTTGECVVKLEGCHIEPHTVYPCLSVNHPQSTVILENTSLIIDPAVTINVAAFSVVYNNTTKGLIIRNLDTIQSANYLPQINSQNCVLVSGGGRVDIDGYSSNINGYSYAIATSNNLIYNGDGEKGTTAGWTTYATYGGPASLSIDTSVYRAGTKSLKLTTSASSIYIGQAVPCKPGQWVFAQCWNKLEVASGTGNTFIDLDFLNAKGEVISTIGYTNLARTSDWVCRRQLTGTAPVAPAGTVSVRVYIGVVGSASTTAWYDNIIVNVA